MREGKLFGFKAQTERFEQHPEWLRQRVWRARAMTTYRASRRRIHVSPTSPLPSSNSDVGSGMTVPVPGPGGTVPDRPEMRTCRKSAKPPLDVIVVLVIA